MRNPKTPKLSLISGASSGIGEAIARVLAEKRSDLILVARSSDRLAAIQKELKENFKIKVWVIVKDLLETNAAKDIADYLSMNSLAPDFIVQNAGIGTRGSFSSQPIQAHLSVIHLNSVRVVELTKEFLPFLRKHSGSGILFVGSVAAYQAVPNFAIYAASKSFLFSFSRALFHELKEEAIHVSIVNPGSTDTRFIERANLIQQAKKAEAVTMTAEQVAKIAIAGYLDGKVEIIPGFSNKLARFLQRCVPQLLLERIAQRIYE